MNTDRPTAQQWAEAFDLTRRAHNAWAGPCPLCGGEDRLHVLADGDGKGVIGCRGCIDGHPAEVRAQRYGELIRAAGFARARPAGARYSPPRASKRATSAPRNRTGRGDRPTSAHSAPAPADIWAAAGDLTATPAERYLRAHRRVWPDGKPFPPSLRWLSATTDIAERLRMPASATGALCFLFVTTAGVGAVSCEALTAGGERTAERWRRTFGKRAGACCVVGKRAGAPVVIVEGEVSALAAAVLCPQAAVIAAGGTANLMNMAGLVRAQAHGRAVEIWADNDSPGRMAARALAAGLRRAGIAARVDIDRATDRTGSDAADWLQQVIDIDGWPSTATATEESKTCMT